MEKNIIVVGDPGRAEEIAREFLGNTTYYGENRGLRTITGLVDLGRMGFDDSVNMSISIITHGKATPSLQIVLGEIEALNEVDFETMN